jgi:hypothetical protein
LTVKKPKLIYLRPFGPCPREEQFYLTITNGYLKWNLNVKNAEILLSDVNCPYFNDNFPRFSGTSDSRTLLPLMKKIKELMPNFGNLHGNYALLYYYFCFKSKVMINFKIFNTVLKCSGGYYCATL